MSGLQHPLEPNGRSTHIRFTPPIGSAGNGGMAAYAANSSAASAVGPQPPSFMPPAGAMSAVAGSTYIRAGAPPIPPMANASAHQQQLTTHQPSAPTNQLAEFNRNPLLCLLCNQAFQNPCLLACYHTFCAACLKGRPVDGKLACPLCG